MSSAVTRVACTAVVIGPRTPWSASSCVGVAPYAAMQALFSSVCSETCTCSGRPSAASTTNGICSAGTARTEWIAAPITVSSLPRSCSTLAAQRPASMSE